MLIYLLFNRVTNKAYIGQTIQPLSGRLALHLSAARRNPSFSIGRSIAKHGADKFDVVVLAHASNLNELNRLEEQFISSFRSMDPMHGYNLSSGGLNKKHSPQTRQRMQEVHKGNKYGVGNKNRLGIPHTEEAKSRWRGKRRAIQTEFKPCEHFSATTEFKKGLIPWNKGRPHSAETIEKLRTIRLAQIAAKRAAL